MKHRSRIFWRAIALCAALFALSFACPLQQPCVPAAYAQEADGLLKIALIALVAIHMLAVAFHHLFIKSPILKRMI